MNETLKIQAPDHHPYMVHHQGTVFYKKIFFVIDTVELLDNGQLRFSD